MNFVKKGLQAYLKYRLYINCAMFCALFLGNCFWGPLSYIAFPLVICAVAFDTLPNGINYLLFCLPFIFINPYISIILFCSAVGIYILKFYCIYIFKEKGKLNLLILIFTALMLIYCVIPIGEYNFNTLLKTAIILIMFLSLNIIVHKPEVFSLRNNLRTLCVSIVLSALVGLTYFASPYLQSLWGLSKLADSPFIRYCALTGNCNVLAMICELTLSGVAYVIMTRQAKWQDWTLFALVSVVGITTFSKTYIILFAIICLSLLIWAFTVNWKRTLIVSVVAVVVATAVGFIFKDAVVVYFNRFFGSLSKCKNFEDFMNMLTTTRYSLWQGTAQYLIQNPLVLIFGRGLGAPPVGSISAHNAYLSMIYQLGIVGSAIFVTTLVLLIRKLAQRIKLQRFVVVPALVLALLLMVEDTMFFIFF